MCNSDECFDAGETVQRIEEEEVQTSATTLTIEMTQGMVFTFPICWFCCLVLCVAWLTFGHLLIFRKLHPRDRDRRYYEPYEDDYYYRENRYVCLYIFE